jgi:hypothetical protein
MLPSIPVVLVVLAVRRLWPEPAVSGCMLEYPSPIPIAALGWVGVMEASGLLYFGLSMGALVLGVIAYLWRARRSRT